MTVLVVYGSKRGGTAQIATRIGAVLREAGVAADVVAARDAVDVARYDAVVVGGSLYAARWHPDARRFVLRNLAALRERPVWFFSSGPLDDSAARTTIAPTPAVAQLMAYVGTADHATFGGRLARDARGLIASTMARTRAGDWGDAAQIDPWARAVARRLEEPSRHGASSPDRPAPRRLPSRLGPVALCLAAGVSAIAGGTPLLVRPDGSLLRMPLSILAHSPFHTFLVPALLLIGVVGAGNVWVAILYLVRSESAGLVAFISGSSLVVWIVVEMILLRGVVPLQVAYLVLGAAIVGDSIRRLRRMLPPAVPAVPAAAGV